jgi:virginiamycin A acetyltransferase
MIRKRFSEELIARLLAVAWWSWPAEEIEKMLPVLMSADVEALLRYGEARHQD